MSAPCAAGRRRGLRLRMTRALGIGMLSAAVSAPAPAENLLQVFELALTSDPEFLAAGAANRAARELRPQARAGVLPSVGVSLDTAWNENLDSGPDSESWGAALNIEQPIYRRERWIALDQADSRIARADALYAAERQALMARVCERYFGVLEARDDISFAQATLEAFEQQLRQSQQRFEVGLIAITDVEEAKAGFDRANAELIAARNAFDTAREALRETSGKYQQALAPLGAMPLVTPEPADIDQWTETALEQNLRILAARHNAQTAHREIDRIQAAHHPVLDAVGTGSYRNDAAPARSGKTTDASIGLRLSLPIFAGGSVLSRTRESRHLYQQALDEIERERRRAQRETRDAYLGVNSGISRVTALEQAVRSSVAAADAIEAGFQVGTRTSVDVLDAQSDLFRSRRDLAEARYRYILDVVRLKRAAGTLSENDLREISTWLK